MNRIVPLCDLSPSQDGRVTSIHAKTIQIFHQLMGLGLLPNAQIRVVQNDSQHVLFFAGFNELAVDREIASEILVELEDYGLQNFQ